jgi:hypothetical protein
MVLGYHFLKYEEEKKYFSSLRLACHTGEVNVTPNPCTGLGESEASYV